MAMTRCVVFYKGQPQEAFGAPTPELCEYMRMGYDSALQALIESDEELALWEFIIVGKDDERAKEKGLWQGVLNMGLGQEEA